MAHMNFSIDVDRVQSSVQAAIRPAVEKALSDYDVQSAIERALLAPTGGDLYARVFGSGYGRKESLLDDLVRKAVHGIAKQFVQEQMLAQRASIEDAFMVALRDKTGTIAQAFISAAGDALKNLEFDLTLTASCGDEGDDD